MKKVGDKVTKRYKGEVEDQYLVKGGARSPKPVKIWEPVIGERSFYPTIILLKRARDGHRELWFPYRMESSGIKGEERWGQFGPQYGENIFLLLLKEAIVEGLFSRNFLEGLARELDRALSK
ncbi:MAG: hypothetical protein ABSF21_04775 [Dehalococcoidia bacterium]